MADGVDRFHAHLDACEQCREHPFDLCATGSELIQVAAREAAQATGKNFDDLLAAWGGK